MLYLNHVLFCLINLWILTICTLTSVYSHVYALGGLVSIVSTHKLLIDVVSRVYAQQNMLEIQSMNLDFSLLKMRRKT